MGRTLRFACYSFLFCTAAAAHADATATLEERMSYRDFTRLGLDKLSPEQLKGLNEWMASSACAPTRTAGAEAPKVAAPADDRVTSRLVGDFTGWQKGTVLTLANGQKWEVRDDEPLVAARRPSPEVTIDRGLLGGWTLSVSGEDEIAHVIPAH